MPRRHLSPLAALLALALAAAPARADDASLPASVAVPEMKTSIYVGSVTLRTTAFARAGDLWSATYEAKVFPWAFWSEHGAITITLPEADLVRLGQGETVNFTGDATNHKGKPREVTGRAVPADPTTGRIKVRIRVDGVELVFNGDYTIGPPADAAAANRR
ncbi:MAG: hypothetical protein IAE82_15355 [Opitutaceae bacterium]|nr:hypothetical protein [Opitutaceae bacterium]